MNSQADPFPASVQALREYGSWTALFIGAGIFAFRGIYRSFSRAFDYAWNYLSARAWMHGENPYDLALALARRPGDFPVAHTLQGHVTPYLPAVFPLAAPFAALNWRESTAAFAVVSALLWLYALHELGRLFALSPIRRRFFYALGLVGYPIQTALSLGQFSAPAIALLIVAWCQSREPREAWPAETVPALLGCLSLALKPQIGAIFVVLLCLERRWRLVAMTLLGYGVLTMVALAPVFAGHSSAANLQQMVESIRAVYDQQGELSCCINLRMISGHIGNPLAMWAFEGLVLAAFAVSVLVRSQAQTLRNGPLFVAVYVLFMLAMYHRPYDLAGLVVAASWLLSLRRPGYLEAALAAALAVAFQPVPTVAMLGLWIPPSLAVTGSWSEGFPAAWNFLIMPHTTWMLAFVFVLILMQSAASRRKWGVDHE